MMADAKILQAVVACAELIRGRYVRRPEAVYPQKIRDDFDPASVGVNHAFARHVLYMCDEIPGMLAGIGALSSDPYREKVMRWLGFVQGYLWAEGYASLPALKRMNMPDEER